MSDFVTYPKGTPEAVEALLELARKTSQRVRIWYGDPETGASWEETERVVGRVEAREVNGVLHPHLVARAGSNISSYIMANTIVRLQVNGIEVYKHSHFSQPQYRMVVAPQDLCTPEWVMVGNRVVARFSTAIEASRWVDFMSGLRMNLSGRKDGV